jgi:hypothetical protein
MTGRGLRSWVVSRRLTPVRGNKVVKLFYNLITLEVVTDN